MRAVAVGLLACSLWLPSAHAQTPADTAAVKELLASARYWAERHRPDLSRQTMRKLLAIHPGHPEALTALGLHASVPAGTESTRPRARQAPPRAAPRKAPTAVSYTPARPAAKTKTKVKAKRKAATARPPPPPPPPPQAIVAKAQDPLTEQASVQMETQAPSPALVEPPESVAATAEPAPADDGIAFGLAQVWLALDQRQPEEGLRLGQALSAQHPERPDVTRALALALRDSGAHGQAREQLQLATRQALDAPSSLQWVARESQRALQALDDRRQPEWTTGMTWVHKPGDLGVSQLDILAQSLRVRQPWADHGHWFAQLDRVRLDAGQTDTASLARTGDWGSSALPTSLSLADIAVRARALGTALALGYETDRWRADVGTTPIGFAFTRLSAGVDFNQRQGDTDWGLSLAHRPVTGSLLSYSGQRDLFSGIRWGAVQRSSAQLKWGTRWNGWEPFAQLELATYRGREVLPNREKGGALGVDRVLVQDNNRYLSVGTVLRVSAFDNNQNHYSVGHGGYYSPQRSTTLTLPLQAAVRNNDLSWMFRAAPSWSRSSTASAARFPTRPDLQALAVAQGDGLYGASQGPSRGWALQSTWEARMNSHWVAGLRVAAERSPEYERRLAHIYLRWHEKPQPQPVPLWPSTVMPHARL